MLADIIIIVFPQPVTISSQSVVMVIEIFVLSSYWWGNYQGSVGILLVVFIEVFSFVSRSF